MGFYDLSKQERVKAVEKITANIYSDLIKNETDHIFQYFSNHDTYIRKSAYLSTGKIYFTRPEVQVQILQLLNLLIDSPLEKVRQTAINAAGEIGKTDFDRIEYLMDKGLFDKHSSVRNAVIGSIKKMGEKNPQPVLIYALRYLHHPDKEIRREICHGIELRGRTHPLDILPLLKELQFDKTARVRNTLVHVIGQIAYKEGCLELVVQDLKNWENMSIVKAALLEIIDVHGRYKDFAIKTQAQAMNYIEKEMSEYLH